MFAAGFPAVVSLTKSFVTLDMDGGGRIASIRERATGRELVAKPCPGVMALAKDGREIRPTSFSRDGDSLVWRFTGGEAAFSVKPFDGGWRFTLDRADVPDASGYMVRLFPVLHRYVGWRANILSDDASALA